MSNLYDLRQFAGLDLGEDRWIIHKLLRPRGKLLLFGDPKLGKSLLALDCALSLEQGQPVWGLFPSQIGLNVLYIQTEVGAQTLQGRIRQMLTAYPERGEGSVWLFTTGSFYLDQDVEARSAFEGLLDRVSPDVVILDPLADMFMGDENKADEAKRLTSYLNDTMESFDFATILIHHMSKPSEGKTRGQHAARGSSVFTAWANSNIAATRYSIDKIKMTFDIRDADPIEPLLLQRNPSTLLHSPYQNVEMSENHLGILVDMIQDAGGIMERSLTAKALSSRLSVSASMAYRIIRSGLLAEKIMVSASDGDYIMLPHGDKKGNS